MEYEIKVTVIMKLQGGNTIKLTESLYLPQSVNNILSVSRVILKGSTMGDTKYKITIRKKGVNMILDTRKGKN